MSPIAARTHIALHALLTLALLLSISFPLAPSASAQHAPPATQKGAPNTIKLNLPSLCTSTRRSAISHDGRFVVAGCQDKLVVVDTTTNTARSFAVDAFFVAISPGGRYIAFTSQDWRILEHKQIGWAGLFFYDLESNADILQSTKIAEGYALFANEISVTDDGTKVLFARQDNPDCVYYGGKGDYLVLYDVATSQQQAISCEFYGADMAMSDDGSTVVYKSGILGIMYTFDARANRSTQISVGTTPDGQPVPALGKAVSISADGKRMIYESSHPITQTCTTPCATFVVVDLASGAKPQEITLPGITYPWSLAPYLSPDGRYVGFQISDLATHTFAVNLYDLQTQAIEKVSIFPPGFSTAIPSLLAVSANGCNVLFKEGLGTLFLRQRCDAPPPCPQSAPAQNCSQKAWTLMVYLDGDNDLDDSALAAFNMIQQLSGFNTNLNIALLYDRAGGGGTYRYAYAGGSQKVENLGELAMNDPATLSAFVVWARATLPASHYALVMDDHGEGLGGLMQDDSSGKPGRGANMSITQLGQALRQATENGAKPLDVLYMHACLMGMIEDAYQIRGTVSYYVASEGPVWGSYAGPAYYDIPNITATMTPRALAQFFALSYAGYWAQSKNPVTISAADLAQLNSLVAATNTLAQRVIESGSSLSSLRRAVQRFDDSNDGVLDLNDRYIDLYDFAERFKQQSTDPGAQQAAQGVMTAVRQYIIANYPIGGSAVSHNGTTTRTRNYDYSYGHGVSIFLPRGSSSFYTADNYDFAVGAVWTTPPQRADASGGSTWGAMLVNDIRASAPNEPDTANPPLPMAPLQPLYRVFLPTVVR